MADCERLATCVFFNLTMKELPATAALMQKHYCRGEWSACARLQVLEAVGGEAIPADLAPNDYRRARALVSGNRQD